jgi:tetratricopeptide (TPR) repeat protein
MSSKIIPLPRYNGPKRKRRRFNKTPAAVVPFLSLRTPDSLYHQAYEIDEIPANYGLAIALYSEAIRQRPTYAIAITNLGNVHFRKHNPELAEQHYMRALALEPCQPEANYNMGYLLLERGGPDNLQQAEMYLRRSLAADPKFADAWFNLGMCLEQQGRPAELCFQRYTQLDPVGYWVEIARRHY